MAAKAKTQNKKDLKGLGAEALEKELVGLREERRSIHFKAEGARSKNVKELWSLKKQVARVLTRLHELKGSESK